jgi:hypothetical protein
MNLRPQKPCAVIKGTKWLRNYAYLIWKCNLYAGAPHFTIYIAISCITTSGAPEFRQTLQCSEGKNTGNIIMLLQGHLAPSQSATQYANRILVKQLATASSTDAERAFFEGHRQFYAAQHNFPDFQS